MSHFIAIAGNMGAGKSELTERLARRLGSTAYPEPAADNPYLSDFYGDMPRWSFHSQIFFLAHRLREHATLIQSGVPVIQDRSVYENAEIFARNLFERGMMSERDWHTYQTVYATLVALLPPPTLIIYLRASVPTLISRIRNRGRAYERSIDPSYLAELNALYENWATHFTIAPVLRVETDHVNFVDNAAAVDNLASEVAKKLPMQQLPIFNRVMPQ